MTFGAWKCLRCGYTRRTLIYAPLKVCPNCGAEYEIIKVLEGVHIAHGIPVTRLKGTNKLNVVSPICISLGENEEAIKEYFKIVDSIWKEDEEKLGEREMTGEDLKKCSEFMEWLVKFGEKYGYKIKFTGVKQENMPKKLLEVLRKTAKKHPETVETPDTKHEEPAGRE